MAVYRVEKTKDYTVMANYHLRDENLSLRAKGLLSLLLSLPDDWNITIRGLMAFTKDGFDSIQAVMKELRDAGYISGEQKRGERGKLAGWEYTIRESPQRDLPCVAKPCVVKPRVAKPAQQNTELQNTDQQNTNIIYNITTIPPKSPDEAKQKTDEITSLLESSNLSEEVKTALRGWIAYKAERKEKYVPRGFASLLTQVAKNAKEYGDDAVVELITECEGCNYAGIIWDKLSRKPQGTQITYLSPKTEKKQRTPYSVSPKAPADVRNGLRDPLPNEMVEYPAGSNRYIPYWEAPGYDG